jgi:hydroxymethylbilane synthase
VRPLRIGTRRSALAVAQSEQVRELLAGVGTEAELVPMSTRGDEGVVAAGTPRGMKGLWTDAITDALLAGDIDVAVHSAKDLPAEDPDGLLLAGIPPRADPYDVLIVRDGGRLAPGSVVGTSSVRRRAQLLAAFPPGIVFIDLRGNVDTRLRRLANGDADAAVLAAAGLDRLGLRPPDARTLDLDVMVPAPGQGSLALQCRTDDPAATLALGSIDDPRSHRAFDAERSVVRRLGGGCALPLGAFAISEHARVHLTAVVATLDGETIVRSSAEGRFPDEVAEQVTDGLLSQGAGLILAEIEDA